jgi:hypothetical protein
MEHVIATLGKHIYSYNDHHGYTVRWDLIGPLCKKWSRNRDSDSTRVQEMLEHFHKGGYIPLHFHLAEVQGEGLVCYDGNHRREVLNTLNAEEQKNVICIVDIMFDASQNDVYKAFSNLNKSVQVPAIYVEKEVQFSVRDEIVDLVKSYESKYRPMLSTSSRCHVPHFNRDMFTDNIFIIYTHFNGLLSVSKIATILEQLNAEYAQGRLCNAHTTYRPNVIEKCKTHNLWLFLNRSIPVEHVQKLL